MINRPCGEIRVGLEPECEIAEHEGTSSLGRPCLTWCTDMYMKSACKKPCMHSKAGKTLHDAIQSRQRYTLPSKQDQNDLLCVNLHDWRANVPSDAHANKPTPRGADSRGCPSELTKSKTYPFPLLHALRQYLRSYSLKGLHSAL